MVETLRRLSPVTYFAMAVLEQTLSAPAAPPASWATLASLSVNCLSAATPLAFAMSAMALATSAAISASLRARGGTVKGAGGGKSPHVPESRVLMTNQRERFSRQA